MSGRAHQSFPKADLLSHVDPFSPCMFLLILFCFAWQLKTEWRRKYFDILFQYCADFGVLAILVSIPNLFCVACCFGPLHSAFPCLVPVSKSSYSTVQLLSEKLVPTAITPYLGYTNTDQRNGCQVVSQTLRTHCDLELDQASICLGVQSNRVL